MSIYSFRNHSYTYLFFSKFVPHLHYDTSWYAKQTDLREGRCIFYLKFSNVNHITKLVNLFCVKQSATVRRNTLIIIINNPMSTRTIK